MLVTSPPEKNTTIRGSAKHCGNVPSGSSSSVQNINKRERSAWRSGPQGTEAERLVANLLGPKRPDFEVTSCAALEEIIEGKGPLSKCVTGSRGRILCAVLVATASEGQGVGRVG